jgi:predicted metal-dependent hydrolase
MTFKLSPLKIQDQLFPIIYKPYAKSRALKLRYSACGQHILITGPRAIFLPHLERFIERSLPWLHTYLPQKHAYKTFAPNTLFPFLGDTLEVRHHTSRRSSILKDGFLLHVMGPLDQTNSLVAAWIKKQAQRYFEEACGVHAPLLGVKPHVIRINDPKTRWGSCSGQGTLSFSWRLALAPREISCYVAIHELCHLKEMNHKPAFWKLVASVCPQYKEYRQWLKEEGSSLHAWRI